MKFTQIPQDTFKELVLNAGVLLSAFSPDTAEYDNADIIGATSGGLAFAATPSFSDFGEDIDNCPKNTKELKRLEGWEVKLSGTFVSVNATNANRWWPPLMKPLGKSRPETILPQRILRISGLWPITPTKTARKRAAIWPSIC